MAQSHFIKNDKGIMTADTHELDKSLIRSAKLRTIHLVAVHLCLLLQDYGECACVSA